MRLGRVRHESKYLAIKYFFEEKGWNVSWMCKVLKVSRASYYKWLHREKPALEKENEMIAVLITEYDERFCHILGYRRMRLWINHFNDTNYSRNRIHRIMKVLDIHSLIRKKKAKYINAPKEQFTDNILKRDFYAQRPNEKWATDVTEFKVPHEKKKVFLSAILDLYDRSVVSYEISGVNNNPLVFRTFDKAIAANPDARPIFHSDRGFQYTSAIFKTKLTDAGMTPSMSRVGHCIDNGPTEGFWGIVKSEMYCMYDIHDKGSLIQAINDYIYFYNYERLQERYGCQTPMEVREVALKADVPASYPIAVNKRIEAYKARYSAT